MSLKISISALLSNTSNLEIGPAYLVPILQNDIKHIRGPTFSSIILFPLKIPKSSLAGVA